MKVQNRLRKANRLLNSGDFQGCIRLCHEILLVFPKNREARRLHEAAVYAANPDISTVREIQRLFDVWDREGLNRNLERLLREFPDSHVVKNLAGAFFSRIGDHDSAAKFFVEAAGLAPTETGYLKNAGIAFYRAKKNSDAIQSINRALKLEPENPDLHVQLGNVNAALGFFDKSIGNYRRALELNSANLLAHVGLLRSHKEQRNATELHRCFDIARNALGPVSELLFEYASCLSELGILDSAARIYSETIELDPQNADGFNNLGVIELTLGRVNEAIANFQKAIDVRKKFPEAALNLMIAFNKGKRPLDALALLEKHPDELGGPRGPAWRYERMGALYLIGRIQEARNGFLELAREEPVLSGAAVMWQTLQTQLDGSLEADGFREYIRSLSVTAQQLITSEPMIWIVRAIAFYMRGDVEQVNQSLEGFAVTRGLEQFEKLTDEEKVFCNTYDQYLKKLLVSMPIDRAGDSRSLFHIGESHCLSYLGSTLVSGGSRYRVEPKIVFGIKAFHLSGEGKNRFKAMMKHQLDAVPAGSAVLISIGEIDCRENDGLIPASHRKGIPLLNLVTATVSGYVNWIKQNTIVRGLIPILQNIPAPVPNSRLSLAEADELKATIEAFNSVLADEARRAFVEILDVHSLTDNGAGFSNMRFHCDQRHLDHRIFEYLEADIAKYIGSR